MGLLDDISAVAESHEEQVEQVIDKIGDAIDEKTDGKFADQVDQAQDFLKSKLGATKPSQQG